jgi:hypothetical protein
VNKLKLKYLLNMTSCKDDYVEIRRNDEIIYLGLIEDYLNNKKSIDGNVKNWFMYVENYDYPVLCIIIE